MRLYITENVFVQLIRELLVTFNRVSPESAFALSHVLKLKRKKMPRSVL